MRRRSDSWRKVCSQLGLGPVSLTISYVSKTRLPNSDSVNPAYIYRATTVCVFEPTPTIGMGIERIDTDESPARGSLDRQKELGDHSEKEASVGSGRLYGIELGSVHHPE